MKAKQCSYPGCTHIGALWQSIPKLCKTHALMIKAEEKAKDTTQKPVTFTSNSTAKKVEKVYSTKIPHVSEKQVKRLAEYRKVRDKWMKENPFCEVCGTPYDLQLHHRAGRTGSLLCDTRYFMTVCASHHRYIEEHPDYSKARGYSVTRLDKSA